MIGPMPRVLPLFVLGATFIACGGSTPTPVPANSKEDPTPVSNLDPRYVSLPEPKPAPAWAPPPASKTTLENGLSVWQMGGATTPLVSIHLMLPTGGATDPLGKEGLSLLTADMLDEGAGSMSALELSDKLGELATDYDAQAGVDYVLLSMDGLAENLEASLKILADIVRRPKLLPAEFERRKKHHHAAALSSREDPAASRAKGISRVLFGNGYAGGPTSGTVESLEAITLADVKKHAKRMTVPEGAHLTIAGKVDGDVAMTAVKNAFGDWKGKPSLPEVTMETQKAGKRAYVIDYPGATQSALGVVTRAQPEAGPKYFAEEVMNERLGQSFTSRINLNLREDKGFTYGAFSMFRRYQKAGFFGIFTNVKTETTGQSVKEIYSELAAICGDRPLSQKERDEAVEGLLLGFPIQFDEVSSLGLRLVTLPIHDRPADFWETWPAEIKSVTTQRANAAAEPFCDESQYTVVVAGDATQITPLLQAQGLEVSQLDRDGNLSKSAESATKPQ